MEIILAKTAGFCFGVKRAVNMAFEHIGEEATYSFGPIIHNEVVTRQLEKEGIAAIHKEQLNDYHVKQLIIRSHGVSPELYEWGEKNKVQMIDATCPYVRKIHRYVQKYHMMGYGIIIVGNAVHPEVKGISGWAMEPCIIVKDAEEMKKQPLDLKRAYFVVAQTTYKKQMFDEILKVLKERKVTFEAINTICNATKERQEEATALAGCVDVMFILGSQTSSNTLKLYEICQAYCKKSYCIEGAAQLKQEMLIGSNKVGITAGASTPQSVIDEVIQKLKHMEN